VTFPLGSKELVGKEAVPRFWARHLYCGGLLDQLGITLPESLLATAVTMSKSQDSKCTRYRFSAIADPQRRRADRNVTSARRFRRPGLSRWYWRRGDFYLPLV